MKTIKINEDAWMALTLIKYGSKSKNYSEAIKTLYEEYKDLKDLQIRSKLNEK